MEKILLHELKYCLEHREKKWSCTFWWGTICEQCAAPYLAWKLITGEVIHWDIKRLTLENRKEKVLHLTKNKLEW